MVKILQAFSGYLKIFFRYLLLPVLVAVYFLRLTRPGEGLYEIIYILSISALVGYWTNYFAIKMLFRPQEKTLLGFQGVVPANKNRIALDLGRVVKEKFFHTEDIIAYIEEKELIKKFFEKTKEIVDEKLKDREVKKKIIAWINEKFNTYSPKLYVFLAERSEVLIRRYFSKSFSPEKVIRFLADYLETTIENGTIDLDKLTDAVVNFVKQNIPQIADYLYKVLEKEIEDSSLIRKIVLRIGAFIFDVNPETVKNKVKKAVHEREFREKVYRILVQVTSDLRVYLNREEVSSELAKHIKRLQEFINTTAKDSLVPALLTRINDFLSKDEAWEKIENIFDTIIDFSSRELEKIIASREFLEFIKTKIPDLLEKFDVESLVVERAQKFDTEQVEEVILRVSGDQLCYIEILGGIIGAVAGIAIFDLEIFSLVFASVALIVFFDFTLTRLRRKKTAIS